MLITIFLQSLTNCPVRNHLFHIELKSLKEAITTAVQEDFSVRQAHTSLIPYPPSNEERREVQNLWTSAMLKARNLAF